MTTPQAVRPRSRMVSTRLLGRASALALVPRDPTRAGGARLRIVGRLYTARCDVASAVTVPRWRGCVGGVPARSKDQPLPEPLGPNRLARTRRLVPAWGWWRAGGALTVPVPVPGAACPTGVSEPLVRGCRPVNWLSALVWSCRDVTTARHFVSSKVVEWRWALPVAVARRGPRTAMTRRGVSAIPYQSCPAFGRPRGNRPSVATVLSKTTPSPVVTRPRTVEALIAFVGSGRRP